MSRRAKEAENGQTKADKPEAVESVSQPAEQAPQAEAGKPSLDELAALTAQVREKEKEIAELKDKYLRVLADHENARKRLRQQSEESIRLQRESLLRELLPIVDHLELALAAARDGGNGKPIVEGVEMVLRSMQEFLRGHGVRPHEAVGQPFDPQFHEAVDQVESLEYKPNTVISEFNRGYQIGDRVLRPARVSVAKAPAEAAKASEEAPAGKDGAGEGGQRENKPEDVENN